MKIVQINAVYHFSSTGRTTEDMHLFLKSKGVESYVFCINVNQPQDGIYHVGNKLDHKAHAFLSRLIGLRAYFSNCATISLIRKLKKIQPDIVVLRNLHTNFISLPMIMSYLAENNINTVWVLHDCWAYTGGCTHYTVRSCFKWQTECKQCLWKGGDASYFFDRSKKVFSDRKKYFGNLSDLSIVGVSDWVTNEVRKSFLGQYAKRILRIYNWVDLDVFYPRQSDELRLKHSITDNDFVVLGVAQIWSENKGLSLFIEIAKHFPQIKVMMIGSLNLVLPSNVIHVDAIDNTDLMAQYYSLADVFLNFSQQETFGKVAAESIACGTPVIANNNTANPEVVGDCGYVITNNSMEECIASIEKIIEASKRAYTNKCVERARKLFSKTKGLETYYKLFREIIGENTITVQ